MRQFPQAVAAFKAGDISDANLYRTIMAWPAWIVPTTDAGPGHPGLPIVVLTDHRGWKVMELFSDQAALDTFRERVDDEPPGEVVRLAGFHVFSTLADEAVQRINLDLHSPHATHFFEQQIPLLRAWADVVAVELALTVPERIGDPFATLRRFDGYNVLMRQGAAEKGLVMAPDTHDRTMAAVFTADDTVDEFIGAVGDELDGELSIERMDGETLFGLLDRLPLDGIVFNPLGHLPPVALAPTVIERILATSAAGS